MTKRIADVTLGIGSQARAVLAMLEREPDFAEYIDGDYDVEIQTYAWYNGRERGVVLVASRFTAHGCLVVTFGECRNSDHIFVDHWPMEMRSLNPPTVADFPDVAYAEREHFLPGYAGVVADHIYGLLTEWYATHAVPQQDNHEGANAQ